VGRKQKGRQTDRRSSKRLDKSGQYYVRLKIVKQTENYLDSVQ
jgi:hypothetical protein